MKEETSKTRFTPEQIEEIIQFIPEGQRESFKEKFGEKQDYKKGDWYYFEHSNITCIGRFFRIAPDNVNQIDVNEHVFGHGLLGNKTSFTLSMCKGPATPSQIEAHLKAAAEKKGIVSGVKVKSVPSQKTTRICNQDYHYYPESDTLYNNNICIYEQSTWAEILPEEKPKEKGEYKEYIGSKTLPWLNKSSQPTKEEFEKQVHELSKHYNNATIFTEEGKFVPPPLPSDGKWCIERTPENADMVNKWANSLSEYPDAYYSDDKFVHSDEICSSRSWSRPEPGYTEITTEQFNFWVLGERGEKEVQKEMDKITEKHNDEMKGIEEQYREAKKLIEKEFRRINCLESDATMHDQWEHIKDSGQEVHNRCKDGWEPFAATYPGEGYETIIHFKRKVIK